MHRYAPADMLSCQLMTVEEARRLSGLEADRDPRQQQQQQRRNLWSWQTVEGAMSQQVTEEQIDQVISRKTDRARR